MGRGGHQKEQPYKIPDYRIYKISDAPELVAVEKALGAQGLRDPWLRNEVWRYNTKEFSTEQQRLKPLFFRGFKYGFGAFLLTIVGTTMYEQMYPSSDHSHGGHH